MPTCLIIDDNQNNRMVARFIFEDLGFEVLECEGVQDSLTTVASQSCDVVLLDWMMPEIDGIEFLELIRETPQGKALKVIMCTAKDASDYKQKAMDSGADGFIQKPLTPSAAEAMLKAIGVLPA